jgi:hypothetical protein
MKHNSALIAMLILSVLALSACNSVFVPAPTPTPAPTAILPTSAPPPIQPVVASPTASVQSAPLCTVDPLALACTPPLVEERDKFCVKKIPYALMALPVGTNFQPADSGLTCTDEGVRDGMQMVSCTGKRLVSYDLKVCNSTCSAAAPLTTGTAQCPQGYGYNAAAGCCWPMPAPDAGCKLFKVDIGTCE